jgi:hypothetical protein
MKTLKSFTAIVCLSILLMACKSSSITMIGYWANKDKPVPQTKRSLFIMALTANLNNRNVLESALKEMAVKKGHKAITSVEAMGAMNVGTNFPVDVILKKVKELNYDAIFTVVLKDVNTQSHYVRASDNYYNPMSGPYGYGSFGSYYGNYYGAPGVVIGLGGNYGSTNPGYTVEKKTFYLESNLYETSTQDLLLSIQTKAVDPESIYKASQEFTEKLISLIEDERKIKK